MFSVKSGAICPASWPTSTGGSVGAGVSAGAVVGWLAPVAAGAVVGATVGLVAGAEVGAVVGALVAGSSLPQPATRAIARDMPTATESHLILDVMLFIAAILESSNPLTVRITG